jgi:hypothetical protein
MQCMHVIASTLVLTFTRIFDILFKHLNPFTHTPFTNTPSLTHFSQTHTHNHSHIYTNTNTYTHKHKHIHTQTQTHTHTNTHIHAQTHTHTHTNTHIHAQTQTHTHTNTSRETYFVDSRYLSMDIYLTFNSCFLLSQISQKALYYRPLVDSAIFNLVNGVINFCHGIHPI